MKLKFDANLGYQTDAINAIVNVFDGQEISQSDFEISFTGITETAMEYTELGVANRLLLDDDSLLKNIQTIQERNDIVVNDMLQGKNFSIEMETGTSMIS